MKIFHNCEADDLDVVWYSYNEQTSRLRVYRCLLTNCLHGKAVELCLANSGNNRVITTYKCIQYINSIHARVHCTRYSFYHVVLVKFYCDVITRSHLQLINSLINTFFSKLYAFLQNKEEGRPVMVKRKLDGQVYKSSASGSKKRKSNTIVHNL